MISIRRATPDDAAELDTMVRELAAHEGALDGVVVDASGWRALLARPDVIVLFAVEGERVVGFTSIVRRPYLWGGTDMLALDDLYVRAGYRDRGVGGALMAEVARLAAPENLIVQWGVRDDNVAGQRFYARLGATQRTKTLLTWTPEASQGYLASLDA